MRRLDPAIRLRQLVALSEVARQACIVKAARSLAITQPAVSKTIRELEDTLEVELFDRSRRGVTQTRTGELASSMPMRHSARSARGSTEWRRRDRRRPCRCASERCRPSPRASCRTPSG